MANGSPFGGDAQYGGPTARFFGNLAGHVRSNPTC
jgi:glycine cleavage system pyridoxal-binding protein P